MQAIMNIRLSIRKANFLILLFCLSATIITDAQNTSQKVYKGIDPSIRYGQLENGLTYYIRHNETPKARAEFYLVQKVGSLQEENNQRGLTHFLEFMAMNESKNFPEEKGILKYIESIGLRIGENIKTHTGFDESYYMLMNVPVTRQGIIDSSLLILHDWSSSLLLEEETIEKERNHIREKWSEHKNVQMRLLEKQLPVMYPESKYGARLPNMDTGILPIGILGLIENFPRQELVDYYKTWYRPDLQAIIIIGDIDEEKIEQKIKKIFADIPKPVNPKTKDYYSVPDNEIPLISIATETDMPYTQISIFYKFDQLRETLKGTIVDFLEKYNKYIISSVMNERLSKIIQKPKTPFTEANINIGDYFVSKTKRSWTVSAITKPNEIAKALKALITEIEKIKTSGISDNEYKKATENLLKTYENAYNERKVKKSSSYAKEYIDHFINNDFTPGIESEYELIKKNIKEIPIDAINKYINYILKDVEKNLFKNLVISITGTDQKGIIYPSKEEIADIIIDAKRLNFEENEEEIVNKILIPQLPQPGKIISESNNQLFGTTQFKLSNGATVVIKKTDFKKNEIVMNALSPGGTSMFKDEKDIWNIKLINTAIQIGGLGQFSYNNMNKVLKGKTLSFQAGLTPSSEVITGSVAPKDVKTLFEIIYLHFTELRKDNDVYRKVKENLIAQIKNESDNPNKIFSNTFKEILYDKNTRDMPIKENDFEKISYDRMIEMCKERFADASDFVFTFVGNIHIDTIRPLIKQYIASLPTVIRKDIPDEKQETPFHKGIISKHFKQKLETPQTTIELKYSGNIPYNLKNIINTQVLNSIIEQILLKKLSEEENDIYDARISVDLYDFPVGNTSIDIYFLTKPEIYEKVIQTIKSEIKNLAINGPNENELTKTKINISRQMEKIRLENSYWLEVISAYHFKNIDTHTQYIKILNDLTIEDIKLFTKNILNQKNEIEVVMLPE